MVILSAEVAMVVWSVAWVSPEILQKFARHFTVPQGALPCLLPAAPDVFRGDRERR
jgi:hypothetical protein